LFADARRGRVVDDDAKTHCIGLPQEWLIFPFGNCNCGFSSQQFCNGAKNCKWGRIALLLSPNIGSPLFCFEAKNVREFSNLPLGYCFVRILKSIAPNQDACGNLL
jgi:hypothetical protein